MVQMRLTNAPSSLCFWRMHHYYPLWPHITQDSLPARKIRKKEKKWRQKSWRKGKTSGDAARKEDADLKWDTATVTCCLPVECSLQVSLERFTTSPVFSPNLFEKCCWHQIQNKQIFAKHKEILPQYHFQLSVYQKTILSVFVLCVTGTFLGSGLYSVVPCGRPLAEPWRNVCMSRSLCERHDSHSCSRIIPVVDSGKVFAVKNEKTW